MTSQAAGKKEAIVVLGMHRSGTSAMARVLALSGAKLPRNLMAPNAYNVDGYWEPMDVATFNDKVLSELDSGWSDIFGPRGPRSKRLNLERYVPDAMSILNDNYGDHPFIVLKEPRINLLLDLWKTALETKAYRTSFVVMVRNPVEISESLKKRDKFIFNKSILLWTNYMLAAEIETRHENRIFVSYDNLLSSPEDVIDKIETSLGLNFPRRSLNAQIEIEAFLSSDRKHHSVSGATNRLKRFPIVERFYQSLNSAAEGAPWNIDTSAEVADWFDALAAATAPILRSVEMEAARANRSTAEARYALGDLETARAAERDQAAATEESLRRQIESLEENARLAEARESGLTSELASRLRTADATEASLRAEVEASREAANEAERLQAQLRSELQSLRQAAETGTETLRAALHSAEEAARRASSQQESLQAELDAFRREALAAEAAASRRIDEILGSAREAESRQAELQAQLDALRQETEIAETTWRAQLEAAVRDAVEAQGREGKLKAELESRSLAAQAALESLTAQLEQARNSEKRAVDRHLALEAEVEALARKAQLTEAALEERLKQARSDAQAAEARGAELQGELAALRQGVNAARAALGDRLAAATRRADEADQTATEMAGALEAVSANAVREIEAAQARAAQLEDSEREAKARIAQLETALQIARELARDAEARRSALETELTDNAAQGPPRRRGLFARFVRQGV
jgi:hypothetical protein